MYKMIETFMGNKPIFHLLHIVQNLMQEKDSGPIHK
jgi:hypothetical protein